MSESNGNFTGADIIALPEPVIRTISNTFRILGRDWKFTINTEVMASAEHFFRYASNMHDSASGRDEVIMLPTGEKIVIPPGKYLGLLRNFADALVEPQLSFSELAIFGHKIGGTAMNDILVWANSVMSDDNESIQSEVDQAKNDSSTEASA